MSHANTTESRLESSLRRIAAKHDLRIHKSRCRTPESPAFGGYILTFHGYGGNCVVDGADPFPFSLSLPELVEAMEEWGVPSAEVRLGL